MMQATACDEDGDHIYVGQLYVEDRHCLGTPSSVDVVTGGDPGECPPLCLRQTRAEGGYAIYVSTMCAPYPAPDYDTTGSDPLCVGALEALARNDTCLSDGGSTDPDANEAGDGSDADAD
jgi:hypothetical protein